MNLDSMNKKTIFEQIRKISIIDYLIIFVIGLISININRTGFQGIIDDINYIEAARGWLNGFPFLGINHWHNRYPLVLSIAGSFSLFGESDFALSLPATIALFIILFLTYTFVKRMVDRLTALITVVLLAFTPLLAYYAGTDMPEMLEMLFTITGLILFLTIAEQYMTIDYFEIQVRKVTNINRQLILAGVCFGLAFSTREFSLAAILFLGILFLAGYGPPRAKYWWMVLGFAVIIILEVGYYWIYAGDPLYRYKVDLHPNVRWEDVSGHVRDNRHFRPNGSLIFNFGMISHWISPGPISVHWLIDPYISFLTHGNFGLLFWFAVPASLWLYLNRQVPERIQHLARLLVLFSALWFFVVVYVLSSMAQSRYFTPIVFAAVVNTALALRYCCWPRYRFLAISVVLCLVLSNWLLLDLKPDPQYAARRFSEFVASSQEKVYADTDILDRAGFYLQTGGLINRVMRTPAPSGALYFMVLDDPDKRVDLATVVQRISPAPKAWVARLLGIPALLRLIPKGLSSMLAHPYPEIVVIREP